MRSDQRLKFKLNSIKSEQATEKRRTERPPHDNPTGNGLLHEVFLLLDEFGGVCARTGDDDPSFVALAGIPGGSDGGGHGFDGSVASRGCLGVEVLDGWIWGGREELDAVQAEREIAVRGGSEGEREESKVRSCLLCQEQERRGQGYWPRLAMDRFCGLFIEMLDACWLDGASMEGGLGRSSEEGEQSSGIASSVLEGGVTVDLMRGGWRERARQAGRGGGEKKGPDRACSGKCDGGPEEEAVVEEGGEKGQTVETPRRLISGSSSARRRATASSCPEKGRKRLGGSRVATGKGGWGSGEEDESSVSQSIGELWATKVDSVSSKGVVCESWCLEGFLRMSFE
jgi:hypothetical protein